MEKPLVLMKPVGQTPLMAIDAWRASHPEHAGTAACYAGRLDPMASGKLLVLLGDACKDQERYRGLDKEYEVEVLLGLATDTGDALGLPRASEAGWAGDIPSALKAVSGTHRVPYPAFSSKTVGGKPLFLHALEGSLDAIEIPEHDETIYRLQLIERSTIEKAALAARIAQHLALAPRTDEPSKALGADFRQDQIRAAWRDLFAALPDRSFAILKLRVACASGTYMRTLASRIARELGTQGLALTIHRTRMGRYRPMPLLGGRWWPSY